MTTKLIHDLRTGETMPYKDDEAFRWYADITNKAADRIEELERERDALQADNARLREAFQTFIDEHEECQDADEWMAELCSMEALHVAGEALATTPEQSLAAYRNKVIETEKRLGVE